MNILYQITNVNNGKYYIGAHTCPSKKCSQGGACEYLGSGLAIKAAIKKYGASSFRKDVLVIVSTSRLLYQLEEAVVTREFVADYRTYNMRVGGRHSHVRAHSYETRMRMRESHLGRRHTPEHKAKISAAVRMNHPLRGKTGMNHPSYGSKRSNETRIKMRTAALRQNITAFINAGINTRFTKVYPPEIE